MEHAWLLRAEGLDVDDICRRIGVNRVTAKGMIYTFSRHVVGAMKVSRRLPRETRWIVH
jgi:hypothetical protein